MALLAAALAVLGFFVVQAVLASAAAAFWIDRGHDGSTIADLTSTVSFATFATAELLLAGLLLVVVVRTLGAAATGLRLRGTFHALAWASPLLGIVLVGAITRAAGGSEGLVDDSVTASKAAAIVLLVVGVGVAEELLFRGVLLNVLGVLARPAFALLSSALLFGIVHLPVSGRSAGTADYVNSGLVVLLVGLPFAFIWLRSGNIVGLMAAHALIDLVGLLQLGSANIPEASAGETLGSFAVATVVAGGYSWWFIRWWRAGGRPDWHPAWPAAR